MGNARLEVVAALLEVGAAGDTADAITTSGSAVAPALLMAVFNQSLEAFEVLAGF